MSKIVESYKTPLSKTSTERIFSSPTIVDAIFRSSETWVRELLREDISTTADNESSVIIHGDMEQESFLLTGDAGIRALKTATEFAYNISMPLTDAKVYQIPHHGSRHNLSPSVLNKMVGDIVPEGQSRAKLAVASVAKGSDHPRKMVTNAYIRRGVNVYEARTGVIRHNLEMPQREGWTTATKLVLKSNVEEWE